MSRRLVASFLCLALLVSATRAQVVSVDKRFQRTEAMVAMRDGVKLYTTFYRPKDMKGDLPFILLRTPYGIDTRGPGSLQSYLKDLADEGYVFAFQDIRGRFKSEGKFVMSRMPRDPQVPGSIDEGTDTYDTIDWMVKNVPDNNGKVGMLGISYPGWLTVMGALEPHPALKAISPQASPADQFIGDDFHHNGAFRLSYGFEYVAMMETNNVNTYFKFDHHDTYEWYLKLGALSNVNEKYFKGKMPTWNDFVKHPNYDEFWKKQAFDPYLKSVTVPTLNVGGWFDQEDYRGPMHIYKLLEKHDRDNKNFLVMGPWNHGGWANGPGSSLGRVKFDSDTGAHFRAKVQAPWFNWHLKGKGNLKQPEALLFQTGTNRWVSHERWPPREAVTRKLFFAPSGKLLVIPPVPVFSPKDADLFDRYVSDPAKPVPYRPRPVTPTYPGREWREWMVEDQRFAHGRPDVLTYETEPLEEDVTLAGAITAKLFASTSGGDSDFIVRLIDVYPQEFSKDPAMGGFQQLVIGEPVRARFRKNFEKPEPVKPNEVNEYTIDLHWSHHCFKKGHKIMVQVSSTWFPLIDRNPQKFVPNIYEAKDTDFQVAEQRVYFSGGNWSHLSMQILPANAKQPKANAANNVKHIIGHRGSCADRPENTLASYRRAIEAGATMMEMDVRSTKDGVLISLHDADLKRTTNGAGPARNLTFDEIRKLDAGSWFDRKYKNERIPTLREILELGKGKIDVLLDLQATGENYTDEYAARIADEVRKFGDPKRTWLGVRSIENAKRFRKILPEAKQIGLIPAADSIDSFAEAGVNMIRLWPKWLNDKTLIPKVRQHKLQLLVNGTLGAEEETRSLLEHRPDAIASDDPARLVQSLKRIANQ